MQQPKPLQRTVHMYLGRLLLLELCKDTCVQSSVLALLKARGSKPCRACCIVLSDTPRLACISCTGRLPCLGVPCMHCNTAHLPASQVQLVTAERRQPAWHVLAAVHPPHIILPAPAPAALDALPGCTHPSRPPTHPQPTQPFSTRCAHVCCCPTPQVTRSTCRT
jgi:hypothetical protein